MSGFDYVVVGAGSAGAVLAARLSEEQRRSVLLLEAGGPEPMIASIPVFALWLWVRDKIGQAASRFLHSHMMIVELSKRRLTGNIVLSRLMELRPV